MGDGSNRRVALLSIHPQFADAILRGEKRVEFRRRPPSSDTSHVIVYATAPVQKIVGWFVVTAIDADDPTSLWRRYASEGAIAEDAFDAYYASCAMGAAIKVGEVTSLLDPVPLDDLQPGMRAPQSFRYVDPGLIEALHDRAPQPVA
jgi:predicted transcriptional regulator